MTLAPHRFVRFNEIACVIEGLHNDGWVHGDIHLENLILGGKQGKLVDFDLVGRAEKSTYPSTLNDIEEEDLGKRHSDVSSAIKGKSIGALVMQKCASSPASPINNRKGAVLAEGSAICPSIPDAANPRIA